MLARTTVCAASLVLSASLIGCGDDEPTDSFTGSGASGNTGGVGGVGNQGGASGGAGGDGGSVGGGGGQGGATGGMGSGGEGGGGSDPSGRLRLIHLSPDASGVDYCLSSDGGNTWDGPLLEAGGDANGIAYGEATDYADTAAAIHLVALVDDDDSDCEGGILPEVNLTVEDGADYTIVVAGMVNPGIGDSALASFSLEDDNAAPAAGKAHLRFIHMSPDAGTLEAGFGQGAGFQAIWTGVDFGETGMTGGSAYHETDPLVDETFTARAPSIVLPSNFAVLPELDAGDGSITTLFAVGNDDGNPEDAQFLVCDDGGAGSGCELAP